MSQIIISVGREFGSGGRVIAEELAKRFNIPIYDRHLITEIAEKMGMTAEEVEKYDVVEYSVIKTYDRKRQQMSSKAVLLKVLYEEINY